MTVGVRLALHDAPSAPLVERDGVIYSRGDVAKTADALIEQAAACGGGRLMACSDNPVQILAAFDAAARSGMDLYIAHTTLPGSVIDDIAREENVCAVIADEVRWLPSAAAGASRVFMMTSGTTGRPKIVEHTAASLLARARTTAKLPDNRGSAWLLTYQPTGFAGVQVQLTAAEAGGLIVAPSSRGPSAFYEAALRTGVAHISGTPTFWRSFLMAGTRGALRLRQITLGGEGADQTILDQLKASFPDARITHTYASTEAGVVFAVHDGLAGFPEEWLDQPGRGAQLRVRDGFLHIKSPNAMRGYWGRNEQPISDDGWIVTADKVEIADGRVRIIGRDDAVINVGGSKVYPPAVEAVLLTAPGVVEARVFGQPNAITGFIVAAEIVAAHGADPDTVRRAAAAACREKLASYQVPRLIKIMNAITILASGKKGSL